MTLLDESSATATTWPTERRRTERVGKKFVTHMTPWAPGHAAVPIEVVIEDVSETGVGVRHNAPLEIGMRHLLTVPREGGLPVVREYVVVRCDRRGDDSYVIGLSTFNDATPAPAAEVPRITSKRTRMLFIIFGIVGLLAAAFVPLENIPFFGD